MKINMILRKATSLVLVGMFMSLLLSACSPKLSPQNSIQPMSGETAETSNSNFQQSTNNSDITVTFVEDMIAKPLPADPTLIKPDTESKDATGSPIENSFSINSEEWALSELESLKQLVLPYFDLSSPLYFGKDAAFMDYIFNRNLLDEPISAQDWEVLARAYLRFDNNDNDNQMIQMYTKSSDANGHMIRQEAVAGLMKLLSLRYPVALSGTSDDLKSSDILTDINQCDERYGTLIRFAWCNGVCDTGVVNSHAFRPYDLLTYAETFSMYNKILAGYGYPEVTGSKLPPVTPLPLPASSLAWIQQECEDYYDKLSSENAKSKIDKLQLAEKIINPDDNQEALLQAIDMQGWQKVLHEVLGLDMNDVIAYTDFDKSGYVQYDTAAVSIFKNAFKIDLYDCRDATREEMEEARIAVPFFDKAFDPSKFAQMYASGLIKGLTDDPDFSPVKYLSKAEAMLLVKRMVEAMN